jgi:hypothetical protein
MKLALIHIAALLCLLGVDRKPALADGGQVRSVCRQGRYQMTVFTSPTPLSAGLVDISVALQDSNTGDIVQDSQITLNISPAFDLTATIRAIATRESATNKLLKSALIELPSGGIWKVAVSAAANEMNAPIETQFTVDVAPPKPAWISVWPWFTWPVIPIALFGVHRRLVARQLSNRATARLRSDFNKAHLVELGIVGSAQP